MSRLESNRAVASGRAIALSIAREGARLCCQRVQRRRRRNRDGPSIEHGGDTSVLVLATIKIAIPGRLSDAGHNYVGCGGS